MDFNRKKSLIDDINNFLIIKVLIFFVAGIITGHFAETGFLVSLSGTAIFLGIIFYTYFSKKVKTDHRYRFLNGIGFMGLWIFFGMFIVRFHHVDRPSLNDINNGIKYGIVNSAPEEKPKSYKAIIELQNTNRDEIVAYFEKDSAKATPQYGDLIAFYSEARYISNSGNPLEFDYAKHMQMQGIYCSSYIKSKEYQILVPEYQKGIRYYGAMLRQKLIDIYRESGISGKELAVLEALTLGYKADLDNETVLSFQTSGAMHILAVSGLHTGIIMLITNILLSFMNYGRKTRFFKSIIVILILWLFAAITGFSSSVCRSALMFSLVQMSQLLSRNTSTYNTVAMSAFILLIINPMLIFNVGFGLSYLAVISIISCSPLFDNLKIEPDYVNSSRTKLIAGNIWNIFIGIIIVSMAAQIGTGVLSIKTFGLFPVYFLLTNIIVLPLSYSIMISAILLLGLNAIAPVASAITAALKFQLEFLTGSVSWIEALPCSSVSGIFVTKFSAIMLYAIIVFIVLMLHYKEIKYLKMALISSCVLICGSIIIDHSKNIEDQLIIYNKNREPLYSVTNGKEMTIYGMYETINSGEEIPPTKAARLFAIGEARRCCIDSVSGPQELYLGANGASFYVVKNKKQISIMKDLPPLKVNYLILSGKVDITADDVRNYFGAEEVIFDSSVPKYIVDRHEEELKNAGLQTHYVSRDGAFIYGDGQDVFGWY